MKLFVDSFLHPPQLGPEWIHCRSITDAITQLSCGHISHVSMSFQITFHHALCCPNQKETFEPVARYIALMKNKPLVTIHTDNEQEGNHLANILGVTYKFQNPYDLA